VRGVAVARSRSIASTGFFFSSWHQKFMEGLIQKHLAFRNEKVAPDPRWKVFVRTKFYCFSEMKPNKRLFFFLAGEFLLPLIWLPDFVTVNFNSFGNLSLAFYRRLDMTHPLPYNYRLPSEITQILHEFQYALHSCATARRKIVTDDEDLFHFGFTFMAYSFSLRIFAGRFLRFAL